MVLTALLPLAVAEGVDNPAMEVTASVLVDGKALADTAMLQDGNDATACSPKKNKTITITLDADEGKLISQVYLRMAQLPDKAELQTMQKDRKWQTAAERLNPGPEFVMALPTPAESVRLVLTLAKAATVSVTELRAFTQGSLPENIHAWQANGNTDVLLVTDDLAAVDMETLSAWMAQGHSVAVGCLSVLEEDMLQQLDRLWNAGLRLSPLLGNFRAMEGDDDARLKAWGEKGVTSTLTSWIRCRQPLLLVRNGGAAARMAEQAAQNAREYTYDLADAAINGLWIVPAISDQAEVSADMLAGMAPRSNEALRAWCSREFASALHGDPATIPYPADRLADGYLAAGEFVHEDPENGLWAYLSPTVQVEIIRYEQPESPRVWFVTDLHFKPESEKFGQVLYAKASFKGQQIYPETLAQTSQMVLAINGDYYPYRVENRQAVGNILRQGVVIHDQDPRKSNKYPNLDSMALTDAGTLEVYHAGETTATALAARGDIHDVLSFGPYLARNGKLRIYDGNGCDAKEPRTAMGMVAPGHFRILTVEGRMPKKGHQGMNLNELAMLMYAQGVSDAFSLDGGSTSVLVFMGTKLNVTGKGTSIGPARNQHELFGVGTSALTHTDKIDKR